jgi:hypothetical protein
VRDALLADDGKLLAECEVDTYRASGPGGQKRNKTESAVRLRHKPSGLSAIAEESRSQSENRGRALRRLRKELALRLREPAGEGVPEAVRVCIDANGRLKVGQRDGRYIRAVAAVLDLLEASGGAVSDAADRLGVTTGNLSAFLTDDDDVMVEANRIRARHAMRPLRRD